MLSNPCFQSERRIKATGMRRMIGTKPCGQRCASKAVPFSPSLEVAHNLMPFSVAKSALYPCVNRVLVEAPMASHLLSRNPAFLRQLVKRGLRNPQVRHQVINGHDVMLGSVSPGCGLANRPVGRQSVSPYFTPRNSSQANPLKRKPDSASHATCYCQLLSSSAKRRPSQKGHERIGRALILRRPWSAT